MVYIMCINDVYYIYIYYGVYLMCMWHVGPDVFNDLFGSNPSREAFEAPVIPQQETLSPERPWLYVHQ